MKGLAYFQMVRIQLLYLSHVHIALFSRQAPLSQTESFMSAEDEGALATKPATLYEDAWTLVINQCQPF